MQRRDADSVVVFGSLNADTSYRMPALPAPGETVLAESAASSPGGKGANQAIAASAAGARTRMVGTVGDDVEGASLLDSLAACGVATDAVVTRPGALTGRAVVLVDGRGENSIVVLPGANALLDDDAAVSGPTSIAPADVLVLQNEVPASANRGAAHLARRAGALVVWNAAPAPTTRDDLVLDVDLLVVNENELSQIAALLGVPADHESSPAPTGAPARHAHPAPRIAALLARTIAALRAEGSGISQAVCTLGADGAVFVDGGHSGHVSAPAVVAVDTTAAGDTVVGYLAAHASLPLEERLLLAGTAGALAVTRPGASSSIPHLAEVERMLAATPERTTA